MFGKRKTGSNYLSAEGTEGLVTAKKTLPLDNVGVAYGGIAQANRIVAATASGLGQPGIAAGAGVLGGTLGCVAPVLSVAGAVVATEGLSSLMSDREKAKANVLHGVDDAGQFWTYLEKANSEEADLFLDFDEAAVKVFNPTKEELAKMAAAKAGAGNQVVQQVASAVWAGAAITSLAAPTVAIAAPAAMALAPLAAVGGGIDVYKGMQERLGQLDLKERAEQRKAAMLQVLELNVGHDEYPLLEGIVHSLAGWHDRLIDQAERGIDVAGIHIGTAGAVAGGMTGLTVTAGVVLGGVLTAPLLGPVGAVVAVPGLIWGGVSAKHSYDQHRIEHKSKWRQRAVRALGFEMSRTELEQKLAGTHTGRSWSAHDIPGRRVPAQRGALRRLPGDEIQCP